MREVTDEGHSMDAPANESSEALDLLRRASPVQTRRPDPSEFTSEVDDTDYRAKRVALALMAGSAGLMIGVVVVAWVLL